jgi:hypothetical protein
MSAISGVGQQPSPITQAAAVQSTPTPPVPQDSSRGATGDSRPQLKPSGATGQLLDKTV